MAELLGASGNSSPGPISIPPGAGAVVILVTVSGSHLHKQALGGETPTALAAPCMTFRKEERIFFFEKKKQKTFVYC